MKKRRKRSKTRTGEREERKVGRKRRSEQEVRRAKKWLKWRRSWQKNIYLQPFFNDKNKNQIKSDVNSMTKDYDVQ